MKLLPVGMVRRPLDLTIRDRRLLVPNTSSKKPTKERIMPMITSIKITLNKLTIAGVKQAIASDEKGLIIPN